MNARASAIPSARALASDVQRTSVAAWCDLYDAADEALRKELGLRHVPLAGGALFIASRAPHMMLNRLVLAPPSAVDSAVTLLRAAGVTTFLLSFDAGQMSAAREAGEPLGLTRFRRPWGTLARRGEGAPPQPSTPDGMALRVARPEDGDIVGRILCAGFDLPMQVAPLFAAAIDRPRWNVLVADAGGEVAGAGLAFTDEGGTYLFAASTAKRFRRRGVQRALVMRRVRDAMAHGARVIGSETGVALTGEPNPSWHNLEAGGLAPVHVSEHLCPHGSTW